MIAFLWTALKILIGILPFILLCFLLKEANVREENRFCQFPLPGVAIVYVLLSLLLFEQIESGILSLMSFLGRWIPMLQSVHWENLLGYLTNILIALVFLLLKLVLLPFLRKAAEKNPRTASFFASRFYQFDEIFSSWVLIDRYRSVKSYLAAFYWGTVIVTSCHFIFQRLFPDSPASSAVFYPVFGVLILGEITFYLSGLTRSELAEDVMGEDEESARIANYGILGKIFRELFGDRILSEQYAAGSDDNGDHFGFLDQLKQQDDELSRSAGEYFSALREEGRDIDANYVQSSLSLLKGESVLFYNPFYKDLTPYIMLPLMKHLLANERCLVISGRDSLGEEAKTWLQESVFEMTNVASLWKTAILSEEETDAEIGILRFRDLYHQKILERNRSFLQDVGFVILLEPSNLLATGQLGLSMVAESCRKNGEMPCFCICDRNCDGLVDALSHILKTNLLEVTATLSGEGSSLFVYWKADGAYLHRKILPDISRYLGEGTSLAAVAMHYQVSKTYWLGGTRFPVLDMKWIAGQYYAAMEKYVGGRTTQSRFNDRFWVGTDLWSFSPKENLFLTVEDEYDNLYEMGRLFSSRVTVQGLINVVSEEYLLRDYMAENAGIFTADAKAIPTISADFAGSRRNMVLRLLIRLLNGPVREKEIREIFSVNGIAAEDVYPVLLELIQTHYGQSVPVAVSYLEQDGGDLLDIREERCFYLAEEEGLSGLENLKNAYFIDEEEKDESKPVGSKLYGHIFQCMLPGQMITLAGKYYEVVTVTPENGVVVRRAADHIDGRKYYRQIKKATLSHYVADERMGKQKAYTQMHIEQGYGDLEIETEGYLELTSYRDICGGKKIQINGIPKRSYRNKELLKITLPGASLPVRRTIALLLNEIFKTTFPDGYPYIYAAVGNDTFEGPLSALPVKLETEIQDDSLYFIEDSDMDLGLLTAVRRNLDRYFGIVFDLLDWHREKMAEVPVTEERKKVVFEELQEEEDVASPSKKGIKGLLRALMEKLRQLFRKKDPGEKPVEEPSFPKPEEPISPEPSEEKEEASEQPVMQETPYQKSCYLKYGFPDFDIGLPFDETLSFLQTMGYGNNPLTAVRKGGDEKTSYQPNREGAHYCDFCGAELMGGEYDLLKDGRERCILCSETALRTGKEFQKVFRTILRNMETFFGVRLNVAVKVRMVDAKKIAKFSGSRLEPTPGFDGRVLGFAQKDAFGYSIYVENGSPKLAAIATLAHELTHIWQYLHWNDSELAARYGQEHLLEVYEGMAKWIEIQYLLYLNERDYANRQIAITANRNDVYGRGFLKYMEYYQFSLHPGGNRTPFDERYPLG